MRLEQVHHTIEAAREERARYLGEALYRGIAHVLRSVQRSFAGTGRKRAPRLRLRLRAAGSGTSR